MNYVDRDVACFGQTFTFATQIAICLVILIGDGILRLPFCFYEYTCFILSQVAPVSLHAAGSSSQPVGDESVLVQQQRRRISRLEKDLMTIHAGVAVTKKKGELATKIEQYAQDELIKATERLQ
jgi:hypothetical protein